eukprot:g16700.t1
MADTDPDPDCASPTAAGEEECGDGDDGVFTEGVITIFYLYVAVVCIMGVFTALVSIMQAYENWSESREMTARTCTRNVVLKILGGFVAAFAWPVLLVFVVFCRNPCRIYRYLARRLGPRRQADSIIDVRRHVAISTRGKWTDRGWIVMLRARHRKPLQKSSQGWGLWTKFTTRKGGTVMNVQDALERSTADVELGEQGRSGWNFRRAVEKVVDMEEEGLFRNIITYL